MKTIDLGVTPRCIIRVKGDDRVGHSVKWVDEHLGVTRDMLRYYEKEKLLPVAETRNLSNKYRDYNDKVE